MEAWSPESVTRTVAGRIAALAPGAREVARACAVLGDGAEPHAIAAIAGLASADAQVAVDSLRAIGILAPEPRIEFAHPIVRTAVEASIPPGLLAGSHATAARLEASAGAPGERVAVHLLASDPAQDQWVGQRLAEAASEALSRGAPEAAVSYLERALAEPPPAEDRPACCSSSERRRLSRCGQGLRHMSAVVSSWRRAREERLDAALLHAHLSLQAGRGRRRSTRSSGSSTNRRPTRRGRLWWRDSPPT